MNIYQIGITGVTGLRNRGVEALVRPMIEQLQKRISNCHITVMTQTPDYDSLKLKIDRVEVVADPYNSTKSSTMLKIKSRTKEIFGLNTQSSYNSNIIRKLDMIISTGGDIFSSDYGDFSSHLTSLSVALNYGKKVVLLGQSIGPFRTKKEEKKFVSIASRSNLITVRESISFKYCLKKLGLNSNRVFQTSDPGFLLKPASCHISLLKLTGVNVHKPYVTVSVSAGISRYMKISAAKHGSTLLEIIRFFLKEKCQVVLIPHVQRDSVSEDDRLLATSLARELNWPQDLLIAGSDYSASELKTIIGGAIFNVAERMHAAIAGLSLNVPTLIVGYSIKAKGILNDLMGKNEASKNLLGAKQIKEPKQSVAALHVAWHCRHETREKLKTNNVKYKKLAEKNFDLIKILAKNN